MPGKKGNRPWVHMHCQNKRKRSVASDDGAVVEVEKKCNCHNYVTQKNKRNTPDRLEIKKYCPLCNAKTLHKESK